MSPTRSLAIVGSLALLAGSCTSTMAIRSMQPGAVNVGSTRHIVMVQGEGRRSAQEFVLHDLDRQARQRGYFSFEDRSAEGITVRIAGRSVTLEGPAFALEPDHAGLRVDVLEWTSARDLKRVERYDKLGQPYVQEVPVQSASVLLAITLFDFEGHTYLSEAEYEGFVQCDPDLPRDQAIELAASQATARFLDDVTPRQVVSKVRLDEDDEAQEPYLETARAGNVAQAAEDLQAYVSANPHNAGAAYNLAVMLEAMGRFEEALGMYDRALALGSKDYYQEARAGCARRLSATRSLSTQE